MSQLQLFGAVSQPQFTQAISPTASEPTQAQAISPLASEQSISTRQSCPPQLKLTQHQPQQAIPTPIAPAVRNPQCPIEPKTEAQPTRSTLPAAPAPTQAIAPANQPRFDPLKHCRLCGALIKRGGLDHSLCSGDCGWVVDLTWLAWTEANRRKRKEPEPQATKTSTEAAGNETLDLFAYGLEGGEA